MVNHGIVLDEFLAIGPAEEPDAVAVGVFGQQVAKAFVIGRRLQNGRAGRLHAGGGYLQVFDLQRMLKSTASRVPASPARVE